MTILWTLARFAQIFSILAYINGKLECIMICEWQLFEKKVMFFYHIIILNLFKNVNMYINIKIVVLQKVMIV